MFRVIFLYGVIAGLIAAVPMNAMVVLPMGHLPLSTSFIIGYTTLLIALSTVFVAVKRRRDIDLGGVIGFLPALGMGLGISFVASIFYMFAYELTLSVAHIDPMAGYAKMVIEQDEAKGASAAALAKLAASLKQMEIQYANPFNQMAEAFREIFPVGVLVSLVSAGLLCNRRFLPARRTLPSGSNIN